MYTPRDRERAQAAIVLRLGLALDLVVDVLLGSLVLALSFLVLLPCALALYAADTLRPSEAPPLDGPEP